MATKPTDTNQEIIEITELDLEKGTKIFQTKEEYLK